MRPTRNIFMHDLQIVFVIEFVARQNAELVARPEERNWNHQGAGKLEGVVLRKGKIGVHLRAPSLERAIPARWLPSVSGTGRDHREGAAAAAAAWLTDPVSGLIDGDPGPDQEAIHQEREWDASYGPRLRPTMIVVMRSSLPPTFSLLGSFHSGHQFGVETTGGDGFHET